MSFIKKANRIFEKKTKVKIVILAGGMIVGAILETSVLALIAPFISITLDPSTIESNDVLSYINSLLGFSSTNGFLAFLAFFLAFVYGFKGVYSFTLNKIMFRFISRQQVALSNRMIKVVLSKPYLYHVSKNSAEIQRMILGDIKELTNLLTMVLSLLSDVFISFFIIVLLFMTSIPMTLGVVCLSVLCILIYMKKFRGKVRKKGVENRKNAVEMTRAVRQALGAIKELKVLQREDYFAGVFDGKSRRFAKSKQTYQVYKTIPRLMIETICFGGAFILIGVMSVRGVNMGEMIPQLSIFVLAAFKLLPIVTRFTGYINDIIFYSPSVEAVYANLYEEGENPQEEFRNIQLRNDDEKNEVNTIENTSKDIIIRDLTFQYPNTSGPVLENVNLRIPEKKAVAFIGSTGAGKTTLADIILGIYEPMKGEVLYGNESVHNNPKWGNRIGYIPQHIYLLDESITANIAFGIPEAKIDMKRILDVIEKAQLNEFVESLPEKLNTTVGDRGVRLSGGQRQRIGIARALYTNPDILVMDEATSALDSETEKAVMDAIDNLKGSRTMIIIAHRLSTIEHCDIICRVEDRSIIIERGEEN